MTPRTKASPRRRRTNPKKEINDPDADAADISGGIVDLRATPKL
jgi:hypothetical protein